MPRPNKQVPIAPNSTTYGERQQLEQMQQQMAPVPQQQGPELHQAATQQLSQMPAPPPGGVLNQPSARPNEPITAGMAMGAGPGPEAAPMPTQQQDQTRRNLENAAAISNNPVLARMAQNARRPIGRNLGGR